MILAGAFHALRAYRACVRHIYASETRLDSLQLKQQRIFFITPLVKAVSFLGPFALNNGIYVIRTFHFWRKYFDLSRKKNYSCHFNQEMRCKHKWSLNL